MKFSVIIPAYNEEKFLPRLLESIKVAASNYSGGRDQVEVVVADNDSTDRTAEVARQLGARVAHVRERRIAAARNGGALGASGEILCFIDADSAIHPQTFNEIERVMNTGRYVWGVTGAVPERKSFALLVTHYMFMPMVWLTGLDIGLSFAAARTGQPWAVTMRLACMLRMFCSRGRCGNSAKNAANGLCGFRA